MPNIKIFVDDALFASHRAELVAALEPLRAAAMRDLGVSKAACQLALVPVIGLADQPALNVELHLMPGAERTRDRLTAFGVQVRQTLHAATGVTAAFRCAQLDPATYIALK